MGKTRKPVSAGLLMIVVGLYMLVILAPLTLMGMMYPENWKQMMYFISSLVMATTGIVATVGGISARKRKKWWLVFTGSICVILVNLIYVILDMLVLEPGNFNALPLIICLIPVFIAIPALVMLTQSKIEFGSSVKQDIFTSI
jgi:hypothetical protein